MDTTLVTVICLCHNHGKYVVEAMQSVLQQTHASVQLIVLDNASTDDSAEVIRQFIYNKPSIHFIGLTENVGYCQAFNQALKHATGAYVIDLAADDVLLPERIATGLKAMSDSTQVVAVHFSDAELIDAQGKHLSFHSDRFPHTSVPQGDVFKDLIGRYFICSPTMMFHTSIIQRLQGYDETLAYEDFDFWIRSSREFPYVYSPEVLVKKRLLKNSMTEQQFRIASRYQRSTYCVCRKILALNKNREEQQALSGRILYEVRVNLRLLNLALAGKYLLLWFTNRSRTYA